MIVRLIHKFHLGLAVHLKAKANLTIKFERFYRLLLMKSTFTRGAIHN